MVEPSVIETGYNSSLAGSSHASLKWIFLILTHITFDSLPKWNQTQRGDSALLRISSYVSYIYLYFKIFLLVIMSPFKEQPGLKRKHI